MADSRAFPAKADAAVPGQHAGKKQRDETAAAESMHHDGSFGRYMQLKVLKLREQFDAQQLQNVAAKSDIFRGVSVHVNGFTRPSHAELKQLMALHGGRFENYLHRDSVTHIICSNLPDTKIKQLAHERKPIPIVRPEWVVASISAGRLLPISDFQLEPLTGAHPNQRRLLGFKRHAAPQLPPEALYPVLQQPQGQGQAAQGQAAQGHGQLEGGNAVAEGRPAKRVRGGEEWHAGAGEGGPLLPSPLPPQQWQQQLLQQSQEQHYDGGGGGEDAEEAEGCGEGVGLDALEHAHQQQVRQSLPTHGLRAGSRMLHAAPALSNHPSGLGTGPGPPSPADMLVRPPLDASPLGQPRAVSLGDEVTGMPPADPTAIQGHLNRGLCCDLRWDPLRPGLGVAVGGATDNAGPAAGLAVAAAGAVPPPPPPPVPSGPSGAGAVLAAAPQTAHSTGPGPGPGAGPGPSSPQAARALAAELRAASELAHGPQRSTRSDPRFMETFFRASRLHFIGTWRSRIEALLAEVEKAAPDPAPYTKGTERVIMHVDMDSFFASVAAVGRPELAGRPVAVSHSNSSRGTSEVSSANYLARSFGVRADMFLAEARRRCPDLVVVPYEFDRYQEASEKVYRILMSYTSVVQPVSCDEAYLDVTGLGPPGEGSDGAGGPEVLAARLRADIAAATECTASAGIGPNMLVAKLATRRAKPNGQFRVTCESVLDFLGDLSVEDLPGVGWSLTSKLEGLGITTVRQVWSASRTLLQKQLGAKVGEQLWAHAHGRDERRVEPPKARKSVGAEVNYGVRFEADATGRAEAERFVGELAGEVAERLKAAGVRGRCLVLKVKRRQTGAPEPAKFMGHGACDNISRSVTLSRFTDEAADLRREALGLLRALAIPADELRGLGITVAKLDNDPASHTSRASVPAAAKLQAPPRTAFDASKPPPWALFYQKRAALRQQKQTEEPPPPYPQQQPQQQPQAGEESCGGLTATTPTRARSAAHTEPRAAQGAGPTAGNEGDGCGGELAGPQQVSPAPGPGGPAAAAPPLPPPPPPLAAPAVDVPAWYASMYNEWSPAPAWEQQHRQAQQRQQAGRPAARSPAAGTDSSCGGGALTAAARIPGGRTAGWVGLRPQPRDQTVSDASALPAAGRAAAAATAGEAARSRSRPRLHPVFAALLSQPIARTVGGDTEAGTAAGGSQEREDRAATGLASSAPVASGAGAAAAAPAAAAAAATAAAAARDGRTSAQRDSLVGDGGDAALATLREGQNPHQQQLQQQLERLDLPPQKQPQGADADATSIPDPEGFTGAATGNLSPAAGAFQLPPAPAAAHRPAVSGTHGGGDVAASPAGLSAMVPRAAPAISTASGGGGPSVVSGGCMESIDLSVEIDNDDGDGMHGGGGGGGGFNGGGNVYLGAAERGEAVDETAVDGTAGAISPRAGPATAAAAPPDHSETTTFGGPAASTSAAASGSTAGAARWPAGFLRPPPAGTAGSAAARAASSAARGRGGRGRGTAGSSAIRGGGGAGSLRGRSGGANGSAARGQGATAVPRRLGVTAAQIDRSVLAELPPDVRRDVEREYGLIAAPPARRSAPAPAPEPSRPAKGARAGDVGAAAAEAVPPQHPASRAGQYHGGAGSDGGARPGRRPSADGGPAGSGPRGTAAHSAGGTGQEPHRRVPGVGSGPGQAEVAGTAATAATGPSRALLPVAATVAMPRSMADVDPAVLGELPAELRSEIIAALRRGDAGGGGIGAHGAAAAAVALSFAAQAGARDSSGALQRPQRPQPHGSGHAATAAAPPPPLVRSTAAVPETAAAAERSGAVVVTSAAHAASEAAQFSGASDVEEVVAVSVLPEGAGPQQRLAAAVAHMFRRSGNASAVVTGPVDDRNDVQQAFLRAIRSACTAPAFGAATRGSGRGERDPGEVAMARTAVHGICGGVADEFGDAGGASGGGREEEEDKRLRVTFMSLALWLIGQDNNLEAVMEVLRKVVRQGGYRV